MCENAESEENCKVRIDRVRICHPNWRQCVKIDGWKVIHSQERCFREILEKAGASLLTGILVNSISKRLGSMRSRGWGENSRAGIETDRTHG